MAVMRFVVVFLMLGTAIGDLAMGVENSGSKAHTAHLPDGFHFSHIGIAIPIICFS
jgi:hypothetical protein